MLDKVKEIIVDQLGVEPEQVVPEAPKAISSYIDALSSSTDNVDAGKGGAARQATTVHTVESYLNKLSTGALKPPSSAEVSSYLDAVSSAGVSGQENAEEIGAMMGSGTPSTSHPATSGSYMYLDSVSEVSTAPTSLPSTARASPSSPSETPPRSYSNFICQECNTAKPSESCVAAISNYLDALAMGATSQDQEANDGIIFYIERIAGTSCRTAVLEYLDEMTSAEKPPSAAALLSYLDGLASRRISPPSTSRSMSLYLNR